MDSVGRLEPRRGSERGGKMIADLRDTIFVSVADRVYVADVRVTSAGVICGIERAAQKAMDLGCEVLHAAADGDEVGIEKPVLTIRGTAKAIAIAEDCVPGAIAKPSGISRAMRRAQVPCVTFTSMDDFRYHTHYLENGMLENIDTPHWGQMMMGGIPWRFERTPAHLRPGTLPGEKTEEIIQNLWASTDVKG